MTKKLTKKTKAAVRAIAAEPASDDSIFGSVRRETEQPPLSLHQNPIVIFLGSAVLVGGLLLILAATAAAKHAQCLEQLGAGQISACDILYMEAIQ